MNLLKLLHQFGVCRMTSNLALGSVLCRLETLSDTLSHEIMVPFGDAAFMQGKIIHTNEVLVLLGDNHFALRTTKQAREIISRRMQYKRIAHTPQIREKKSDTEIVNPPRGVAQKDFEALMQHLDEINTESEDSDSSNLEPSHFDQLPLDRVRKVKFEDISGGLESRQIVNESSPCIKPILKNKDDPVYVHEETPVEKKCVVIPVENQVLAEIVVERNQHDIIATELTTSQQRPLSKFKMSKMNK